MMLPLFILLPLLGAVLIAALPARHARLSVVFPLLALLLAGTVMRGGAEWSLPWMPDAGIALRNSRDPQGPAQVFTRAEIEAFIRGAAAGDFDAFGLR